MLRLGERCLSFGFGLEVVPIERGMGRTKYGGAEGDLDEFDEIRWGI